MEAKKNLAVIPARLGSTRLKSKALRDISGKPLVQRVWEQASSASSLSKVVVATDAEEIADVVNSFGGEVVMTSEDLQSGSERVAVVYQMMNDENWNLILNIQGDMPFINPVLIDNTVEFMNSHSDLLLGTAATAITDEKEFLSSDNVKVVIGENSQALYFSRSPVPYSRDGTLITNPISKNEKILGFRHFGIYIFRPEGLALFQQGAEKSELEDIEKLEQLRAAG